MRSGSDGLGFDREDGVCERTLHVEAHPRERGLSRDRAWCRHPALRAATMIGHVDAPTALSDVPPARIVTLALVTADGDVLSSTAGILKPHDG